MKEALAILAVSGGGISLWVAAYFLLATDEGTKDKPCGVLATIIALIGAVLLVKLIWPSDGESEMGWGWVALAVVIALACVSMAKESVANAREVLRRRSSSDAPQVELRRDRRKRKAQKPKPSKSRAMRTGWSMGVVEFTYMDAEGDITNRRVTVHSITGTYLKGHCHERGAERTFRLDRIMGSVVNVQTGEILFS
ncbi:WYL domain-containing protein [Pseudomonas sp. UBA6310]|uniref:WYL domain-containing protein n=1 Tax=Pseudomonas sp. UBA6310 TaxID=1947327 RepID=UPI00257ABF96|nr:WYL domain-containing protein [Pseudomonas sp. UBA6310]